VVASDFCLGGFCSCDGVHDAFLAGESLQTAASLMMQNDTETEKHKLPA